MRRRNLLEGSNPLMLPDPFVHTVFFPDGSFINFGEGVVPPHPNTVRDAGRAQTSEAVQAETGDTSQGDLAGLTAAEEEPVEVSEASVAPNEFYQSTSESIYNGRPSSDRVLQPPPLTNVYTPALTYHARNRILNWAGEMEELDSTVQPTSRSNFLTHGRQQGRFRSSATPTTAPTTRPAATGGPGPASTSISHILKPKLFHPRPSSFPERSSRFVNPDECKADAPAPKPVPAPSIATPGPSMPAAQVRCPLHPGLHPGLFLYPDQLNEDVEAGTYQYGSRGAVPVALKSNLCTVLVPRLAEQEQTERNRRACRLNFGSWADETFTEPG
jgi:hypothetical protein